MASETEISEEDGIVRGPNAQGAVREDDWKLIGNPHATSYPKPQGVDPPGKLFLSNFEGRRGREAEPPAKAPPCLAHLKALYDAWLRSL